VLLAVLAWQVPGVLLPGRCCCARWDGFVVCVLLELLRALAAAAGPCGGGWTEAAGHLFLVCIAGFCSACGEVSTLGLVQLSLGSTKSNVANLGMSAGRRRDPWTENWLTTGSQDEFVTKTRPTKIHVQPQSVCTQRACVPSMPWKGSGTHGTFAHQNLWGASAVSTGTVHTYESMNSLKPPLPVILAPAGEWCATMLSEKQWYHPTSMGWRQHVCRGCQQLCSKCTGRGPAGLVQERGGMASAGHELEPPARDV
jgi:hypothetical protein